MNTDYFIVLTIDAVFMHYFLHNDINIHNIMYISHPFHFSLNNTNLASFYKNGKNCHLIDFRENKKKAVFTKTLHMCFLFLKPYTPFTLAQKVVRIRALFGNVSLITCLRLD